ncbi:MAG: hypothetical protein IH571_03870, partial [Acholeplasmataceae bacterium]|nr:hypothetical protein [Acholeplasmataceae bacterium]
LTALMIVLLSASTLYYGWSQADFWAWLEQMIPLFLILITILGLQLNGKALAAHLVLFVTAFLNVGSVFVQVITSFNFSTGTFASTLTLQLIIMFVGFLYLMLYIISCIMQGDLKTRNIKSSVYISALIAFLFFFLRDGFSGAVLKILPAILALMFGGEVFAIMLLLAGVVDIPFNLLGNLFTGLFFSQTLGYYLFALFGLYLIFGAVKGILKKS